MYKKKCNDTDNRLVILINSSLTEFIRMNLTVLIVIR